MLVSTALPFSRAALWQRGEETTASWVGSNLWTRAKYFIQRCTGSVWIFICSGYAETLSGAQLAKRVAPVHLWGGVTRLSAQRAGRSEMP